jgi:hypothetical protein
MIFNHLKLVSTIFGATWVFKVLSDFDHDHQQTPPSLPFARPRAKVKMLVIDQELLLCQLHFKYGRFITKFSTIIWMNWHVAHPLLPCYLWSFLVFSKSWVVARQNRLIDMFIICSLIDYLSRGFESFTKQNIIPQMIHLIAQKCMNLVSVGRPRMAW